MSELVGDCCCTDVRAHVAMRICESRITSAHNIRALPKWGSGYLFHLHAPVTSAGITRHWPTNAPNR